MRKTLEDLYFGNISPNEQKMAPDSELKKAVDRVTRYESQLTERLGEDEQTILTKLIRSQHEINSITALENFILGFRLGARIMAECMDENDGDTLVQRICDVQYIAPSHWCCLKPWAAYPADG